jgi:hypothetical protein
MPAVVSLSVGEVGVAAAATDTVTFRGNGSARAATSALFSVVYGRVGPTRKVCVVVGEQRGSVAETAAGSRIDSSSGNMAMNVGMFGRVIHMDFIYPFNQYILPKVERKIGRNRRNSHGHVLPFSPNVSIGGPNVLLENVKKRRQVNGIGKNYGKL